MFVSIIVINYFDLILKKFVAQTPFIPESYHNYVKTELKTASGGSKLTS